MTLSIELKHGRYTMNDETSKRVAMYLLNGGTIEIRIAGRCVIFDDQPLELKDPSKMKGKKRARKKQRNTPKRR